jgi:hypothetical protein
MCQHIFLAENTLTGQVVLPYTKQVARTNESRVEENNSMLTSRTYKEHSPKWQPCAAMYTVVCSLGLTLSATNIFGGRLGQEPSINSRQTKH